jgi:hypothetical protein
MGTTPGEQDDPLEERRLARGVRSDDQLGTRAELGQQRVVRAQAGDGQASEEVGLVDGPVDGEGRRRQDVVRSGMTTWT